MATSTFNPSTKEGRKDSEHFEKAKDASAQALDKAKEAGTEAIDSAKELGAEAFDKAMEAGAAAYDKTKGAVEAVGEMAADTTCAVGHKADNLTGAAGHEIKEFGATLARKTPHEGLAGHASQAVADTIKDAGRYVEEQKLSGMAHDVEQVIKNHPVPALLICLGIGFCVGRAMKT